MLTGGAGDAAPPAAGAGQGAPRAAPTDRQPGPRPAGQPLGDAPHPAGARTSLARIRWLFSSVQLSEKTLLWRRNSAALTSTQQAAQRRSSSRAHRRQILSRSRLKPGMPLIAAPGLGWAGLGRPLQPRRPRASGGGAGGAALRPPHARPTPAAPAGLPRPRPAPAPCPGRGCPCGARSAPFEFKPRSSAGFCLRSPVPSGPCSHLAAAARAPRLSSASFSPENKRSLKGDECCSGNPLQEAAWRRTGPPGESFVSRQMGKGIKSCHLFWSNFSVLSSQS